MTVNLLEVHPPAALASALGWRGWHRACRQRPPHLLKLRPSRHLLRKKCRLDAVEQTLEPPHQLGLRDPQFGITGGGVVTEWKSDALQLISELGRESLFELGDRGLVDRPQPLPAGVVEWSRLHLGEQL